VREQLRQQSDDRQDRHGLRDSVCAVCCRDCCSFQFVLSHLWRTGGRFSDIQGVFYATSTAIFGWRH